jgi:plasmid stabilization system protein ParE
MRRIRILDEAVRELEEAVAWYETQRFGLGAELHATVEAALDVLESQMVPLVAVPYATRARGVKRLLLRRFPYDIIVREGRDEVVVLAFAHQSRQPGYWRSRS